MPHHALARYEAVGPHRTARHLVPGVGTFYHPSDPPPAGVRRPVFVFACGTYQLSYEYAPMLLHLASHGLVVLGVQDAATKVMSPAAMARALAVVRDGPSLPAPLRAMVDPSRLALGGHSGGGPVALRAAAEAAGLTVGGGEGGAPAVRAFVAQHAAAIPASNPQRLAPNRPSDADFTRLEGGGASMLAVCGVLDRMPYCSCDTALKEYYERFGGPKLLIKVVGAGHMGNVGSAGDHLEGAYVVSYLLATLYDDDAARSALLRGKGNEDILYHELERGAPPTIVTFGHEYELIEQPAAVTLAADGNATAAAGAAAGAGGGGLAWLAPLLCATAAGANESGSGAAPSWAPPLPPSLLALADEARAWDALWEPRPHERAAAAANATTANAAANANANAANATAVATAYGGTAAAIGLELRVKE